MSASAQALGRSAPIPTGAHLPPSATHLSAVPVARPGDARSLSSRISRVLILNSDSLYADLLRRSIQALLLATTTLIAPTVCSAEQQMADRDVDVLVTDVIVNDGDVMDWLPYWRAKHGPAKRAFVVTQHKEIGVLDTLSRLPVEGVFDQTTENFDGFVSALAVVASGRTYWSPSVARSLADQRASSTGVLRLLTSTELMVLAVIGDGCDDIAAMRMLPFTQSTIRSARGSLHHKLKLQHKGELVAFAQDNGFVIRTPFGIVRPGLSTLMAERLALKRIVRLPRKPRGGGAGLPDRDIGAA